MPDGMNDLPVFSGPPPVTRAKPPLKPSKWTKHFNILREHPGQWAVVAEYTHAAPKTTAQQIQRDRNQIMRLVENRWPLERWESRAATKNDTWGQRELYLRFIGTFTEEEQAEWKRQRTRAYKARMATSAEKKARRALAARNEAVAQQEENRRNRR